MYLQVRKRHNVSFSVSILGRYQSNTGLQLTKKVLRYLRRTKEFMLVYCRSDSFEVVGYPDADLENVLGHLTKSHLCFVLQWQEEQ